MKLYCATTNPGKLREFRLAAQGHVEIEPVEELGRLPECVEDGATFEENAAKKALHYSAWAPGPLFADDSGLVVDALGGAPGVVSARFSGPGATDASNNALLLEKLRGIGNRTARFVCVIAVAEQGCLAGTFRGEVEGRILDQARGAQGFGYDPLFFFEPYGCTFGEVEGPRKFEVSHRGRALRAMLDYFDRAAFQSR
ncbi:MAG: RdgB/HAM1 family non-canonical purine NTP pyrophosphatase [Acidobacteria bacterium]|nr:RdgB/HAM1 family non-canonical purine NTP pyrophosphatase [Acidobacteriota bacterium]